MEGGPVTLLALPDLEARRNAIAAAGDQLSAQAASAAAESASKLADAGAILIPRRAEWANAETDATAADQAAQLMRNMDAADAESSAIAARPHEGIGGFFKGFADKSELKKKQAGRTQLALQLRELLVRVATNAHSSIPEATHLQSQALASADQSRKFAAAGQAKAAEAAAISDEILRRRQSLKEMGFDALYTTAYLQTFGAPPVDNPLVSKKGEQALLVQPATLARQATKTQFVGGSQGFSFPIAHTGIRYRVGAYRGHAVQQGYIAHVDQGSLVITNLRIAFVGTVKAVSVNLEKILHVEVYNDALAVFREGKEAPDFFLVGQPQLALFYLNYALSLRVGSVPPG